MGSPKNCFEVVRTEQQSRKAHVSLKGGDGICYLSNYGAISTYLFNLNIIVETLVEFFGFTYFLRSAKAEIIAILI